MEMKDVMEDGWITDLNMKETMEYHMKLITLIKDTIKNDKKLITDGH